MSGKCETPFHGLTVVIDTPGPRLYIGRFDYEEPEFVLLRDVDVRDLTDGQSKEAYLAKTAKYGVFRNTDWVKVPRAEVTSVRRLSEIEVG